MKVMLLPAALASAVAAQAPRPHILSILQDDLGYADTGIYGGPAATYTSNITALAKQGIALSHHYVHWHCSPTRRTFLSGRLPIHHGEQLSKVDTDDMDMRWTWLPAKLQSAGYRTHGFGKMHTGFKSVHQLWSNRGFTSSIGSLLTGGNYYYSTPSSGGPRWQDQHPLHTDTDFVDPPPNCHEQLKDPGNATGMCVSEYSTALWGQAAMQALAEHKLPAPLYIHLCFQAVHEPYDAPPPGFRGPPVPPDAAAADAAIPTDRGDQSCADPEGFFQDTTFTCPAQKVQVTAGSAGACCSACDATPTNCSHWTFDSGTCSMWDGNRCKRVTSAGAISAAPRHPPPGPPAPPGPPSGGEMPVYHQMLWDSDLYVGKLVDQLKQKGMYENTLIIYSADNGGTGEGINWPLRGTKHTNWEGGLRAASFISGGIIPTRLRGSTNAVTFHIADWYPTLCYLAGVSGSDDPPVPPLKVDPAKPSLNIWGDDSFPPVDGVNIWRFLMEPPAPTNYSAAHPALVLTKEVIIVGQYKLLLAQNFGWPPVNNWRQQDGSWVDATNATTPPCGQPDRDNLPGSLLGGIPGSPPCLFDVRSDLGERTDLGSDPAQASRVASMWHQLNMTVLSSRDCSAAGHSKGTEGIGGCSPPALLGHCDAECAQAYWETHYGIGQGPICGVPGC